MTQQPSVSTVVHSVVVDAPIDKAFKVFTEDFGQFKPPEHNMLGVDIAETVFEPREGGHLYDRGVDGSECHWGRVLTYEPPHRVVVSWDIGPTWQIETDPNKTSDSRSVSLPKHRTAPRSSWSTATLTATAKAGKAPVKGSTASRAGRSTCTATPA